MANRTVQSHTPPSASRIPQFDHGGNVYDFARTRGIAPEDVLDFSASINPLGYPPQVDRVYRDARARLVHYPEPYAETLTAALAHYHDLSPEGVLVGNGSTQLIYLIARALGARRALLVAPLFSEHEAAFRLSGARAGRLFLRPPHFALSAGRLRQALTKSYHAVVLTNPNSPTGTLMTKVQMEDIAQLCRHRRASLIVDETFIDWAEEESLKNLAVHNPHVIVLRSLTKFFAVPGLRVGYVIAQPRRITQLRSRLEPWSVNTVAQEAARACLRDQAFIRRSRAFMARERTWLMEQLNAVEGLHPFPSQANFLLVRIATRACTASQLARTLARQNFLIRVCDNFPGLGKQFFRVAVRTREENTGLLAALRTALRENFASPPR